MPVLTTYSSFSAGTALGAGSSSTSRQVQDETAALPDGVDFLCLFQGGALRQGTSTDVVCECDVQFGSTVYAHGQGRFTVTASPPEAGTNIATCAGFAVVTGNGTDTFSIGTRRVSGTADAILWSGGGVKCIPLDSLIINTHYWLEESANSDTAIVTPASASGWVAFGTPVEFESETTGEFLAKFSGEAQFQSDAGSSDVIRVRYQMTTDPNGSPTTITLGGGDNSGELSPALNLRITGTGSPEQCIRHFTYDEVVELTAGTEYAIFMEVEAVSGGGDVEYRKARTIVFDGVVWAGGIVQEDITIGQQPSAGTNATYGPLSIATPSPDTHEYTFLGGTSFANNNSWYRCWVDLDGTRFPNPGGFGVGGYFSGFTPDTSSFYWFSFLGEDDVSAAYDVNLVVLVDSGGGDSPSGFEYGQSGGDSTDPAILTRVIAWRMETTTVTDVTGTLASTLGAVTSASAATSTITGTAAPTLDAVTLASAVGSTVTGTSAPTLDAVTLAGVAEANTTATLAATLDAATLASAGTAQVSGSLASTLDDTTATSAASTTITGTAAPTLDAVTLVSAGTVGSLPVEGTLAVTLDDVTAASAATSTITGTAAPTLDAATLASAVGSTVAATLAATVDAVTLASAASTTITGTAAPTLDAVTLSAAGTVATDAVTGTLSATLDAATLSSSTSSTITGTSAPTLDAVTLASVAATPADATLSGTLDPVTSTAVAASTITGTLAGTLDDATLAAAGTVSVGLISGSLAATLEDVAASSVGVSPITATLAATLADASLVSAANTGAVEGTLAVTLGDVTLRSRETSLDGPGAAVFVAIPGKTAAVTSASSAAAHTTIATKRASHA